MPSLTGSAFLETYRNKSLATWQAAAFEEARGYSLTPWPWIELPLTNGEDVVILSVASDVLSIGPLEDHLRLPLTPGVAQDICNLAGWLMPTPWLVYQTWRAAALKLPPTPMAPNLGANLGQYAAHSSFIDRQIAGSAPIAGEAGEAGEPPGEPVRPEPGIVSGIKKDIVISNLWQPGKVVIFGWYRPEPDLYTNGKTMGAPGRQPIQPGSNVHGDFYVDYSHGVRPVKGTCSVNGKLTATEDVYKDPKLSRLVSVEGPLQRVRYPASIAPVVFRTPSLEVYPASPGGVDYFSPTVPSPADLAAEDVFSKK